MEGQPNMEGLIPITIAVAFPDFLFSHRQAFTQAFITLRSHVDRADLSS
jgi:hypothetical protein